MNESSDTTPPSLLPTEVRTAPPFVGRRPQLHWFAQRLQASRARQAQVVLLAGDTGSGKTRLVEQVRGLAHNQNMQVYHCRCDEDMTLHYLPWCGISSPKLHDSRQKSRETDHPHPISSARYEPIVTNRSCLLP